ncbi:unnamed protein product, partial [Chrysoparadoxa australica]
MKTLAAKLNIKLQGELKFCEICAQGKSQHTAFTKKMVKPAEKPFELVVADIYGPSRVSSDTGALYAIGFVDSNTRASFVRFIKAKSEAPEATRKFIIEEVQARGHTLRRLRWDNAKELRGEGMQALARNMKFKLEYSGKYSPQQMGLIERLWQTLAGTATCMLLERKLPSYLWERAMAYANFIRNRQQHSTLVRLKKEVTIPAEALDKTNINIKMQHPFGSTAWVHIEAKKRRKFQPRAWKGIFVGYETNSRAKLIIKDKEFKPRPYLHVKIGDSEPYDDRSRMPDKIQQSIHQPEETKSEDQFAEADTESEHS